MADRQRTSGIILIDIEFFVPPGKSAPSGDKLFSPSILQEPHQLKYQKPLEFKNWLFLYPSADSWS